MADTFKSDQSLASSGGNLQAGDFPYFPVTIGLLICGNLFNNYIK
jgi:STE24 endopeptidase